VLIHASGVDTGGHFTHQAYQFCARHVKERVYACKGDDKPNQPIKGRGTLQDMNVKGRIVKKGVRLWKIGTDTAKDLLFGRLRLDPPPPGQRRKGYVHLSKRLPQAFFTGLTSEIRRQVKTHRGTVSRWVTKAAGVRNEPLDCTVGCMFVSHACDHHKHSEAQWLQLESAIGAMVPPSPARLAPGQVEVRDAPKPATPEPAAPDKPKKSRLGPVAAKPNPYASDEWLNRLR
jgi:phage terminase large subunit GpA-like protein